MSLIPHFFHRAAGAARLLSFIILLTLFKIVLGFITVFLSEQYFLIRR